MTKQTTLALIGLLALAACNYPKSTPIVMKPSSDLPAEYGTVNCKEIYSYFRKSDGAWMHAQPQFVCVPEKDAGGNLVWRKP